MYYRKNKDGSLLDWSEVQYSEDCLYTEKAIIRYSNEHAYIEGEEPEELALQRKYEEAKALREQSVNRIVVNVDGMKFDGDEVSQTRMSRALSVLGDDETMTWVLYDNTVVQVTKEQLRQALRKAGEEQTRLWTIPHELVTQ